MAQQLNVALNFTANTQQAKTALQDLQTNLTKIAYGTDIKINPGQMQQASSAAKELAFHLNQAYNVDTGKIDLTRLNASLKSAGANVNTLSTQLLSAGQTGQQAFLGLARTMATAEAPVVRLNGLLGRMMTTFKNTMRYQISASVISGITSSFSQALNYAKDLDKSLNNIRIVTGYSSDEMNRFAVEANKAAKALNATTTAYTDASLIFYQQGLTGEAVKERADVVIKLANVTGQSAEVVSDQMTAIWNNFADGSKSMEYYADVITKLGAATASSTDEISDGLEKFAAIAETVGLSYEMATAALATVTAETRQSADVVGTAFKTIFARMEGLKLGDTLDDGTTLNKYSEALKTVGVDIKNQQGELRKMDDILYDIGDRWQTLAKDEQVALAQSVAGVRQYSQFMALMGNWEEVQVNLDIAKSSMGELTYQNEIYADSWEGAKKRVTASLESIYSEVFQGEFFKDFLNNISILTNALGGFIKGMGGIGPILGSIGAVLLGTFANKIPTMLTNLRNNLLITFGQGAQAAKEMSDQMRQSINSAINSGNFTADQQNVLRVQSDLLVIKEKMAMVDKQLSAEERARYNMEIQGFELQATEIEKWYEKKQVLDQQKDSLANQLDIVTRLNEQSAQQVDLYNNLRSKGGMKPVVSDYTINQNELVSQLVSGGLTRSGKANTEQFNLDFTKAIEGYSHLESAIKKTTHAGDNFKEKTITSLEVIANSIPSSVAQLDGVKPKLKEFKTGIQDLSKIDVKTPEGLSKFKAKFSELMQGISSVKVEGKDLHQLLTTMGDNPSKLMRFKQILEDLKNGTITAEEAMERLKNSANNFNPQRLKAGSEVFAGLVSGISSAAMAMQSFRSAFETLKNPDMSGWEKILSFTISITMAISMMLTAFKGLKNIMHLDAISKSYNAVITKILAKQEENLAKRRGLTAEATKKETKEELKNTGAKKLNSQSGGKSGGTGKVGFKGSMKALGPALVSIAIAIAAVQLIKFADGLYNKAENEAKEMGKRVNEATDRLNEAQEKHNELEQRVNDYTDNVKALEGLTKGTLEYEQALMKANEAALELIQSQNLVYGTDYTVDDNGLITISEAQLEQIQKDSLAAVQLQQAHKNVAYYNAQQAELAVKRRDFNRNEIDANDGWSDEDGAALAGGAGAGAVGGLAVGATVAIGSAIASGAGIGAAMGSWAGPIGAAIGAAAGLVIGGIVTAVNKEESEKERAAYNDLYQAYVDSGSDADYILGEKFKQDLQDKGYSEDLINALAKNKEGLLKQIQSLDSNTKQLALNYKALVAEANKDNSAYNALSEEDKKLVDILQSQGAATTRNIESEEYKKANKEAKAYFDGNDQDAYDEWLKYKFGDQADQYRVIDQGGTNATLQKINENGVFETTGEKNSLSNDQVIDDLTEMILLQYEKGSNVENQLNDINTIGKALENLINDKDFTKEDIANIKTSLAKEEQVNLTGFSEELQQKIVDTLSSQDVNDKYKNNIANSTTKARLDKKSFGKDIQDYYDSLSQEQKEIFWTLDIDKNTSKENIEKFLAYAESNDNLSTLNVRIKLQNEAIKAFEDNDYDTLKAKFEDPDSPFSISWENFLKLDPKEAEAYLNQNFTNIEKAIENVDTTLPQNKAQQDTYQNTINDLNNKIKVAEGQKAKMDEINNQVNTSYSAMTQTVSLPTEGGRSVEQETITGASTINTINFLESYAKSALQGEGATDSQKEAGKLLQDYIDSYKKEGNSVNTSNALQEFKKSEYGKTMNITGAIYEANDDPSKLDGDSRNNTVNRINFKNNLEFMKQFADIDLTDPMMTEISILNSKKAREEGELNKTKGEEIDILQKRQQNERLLEQEISAEGLDVDEWREYKKVLEDTIPELKDLEKGTYAYDVAIGKIARTNMKMSKGVSDLASNWEDYNKVMKKGSVSADEWVEIGPEIKAAVQNILDLDDQEFSLLPNNFAQKHWDLITDVVNGVEGAVDELRDVAGQEILMQVDGVVDPNGNIKSEFADIHNAIASFDSSKFTVGVALDEKDQAAFYENCQSIVDAAGMTQEQASAYFGSMGYDVNFKTEPKTVTETVWDYSYVNEYDDNGELVSKTVKGTPKVLKGDVEVPVIETITPNGSYGGGIGVNTTAPKSATSKKPSGGGGGGSKKETKEFKKKDDEIERYYEVNNSLETMGKMLDRISNKKEHAFGKDKIKLMEDEYKILEKELKLQKQYEKEIEANLKKDRKAVLNLGFTVDTTGNINNYDEIMNKWIDEYNAAIQKYNNSAQSEADKKALEDFEKRHEERVKILEQYEETLDLSYDAENDRIAKQNEMIQQATDIFIEAQEQRVEAFEKAIDAYDSKLDYLSKKIERLEEKEFQQAKAASLLGSSIETSLNKTQDNISAYYTALSAWNDIKDGVDSKGRKVSEEAKETAWENLKSAAETLGDSQDELLDFQQQLSDLVISYLEDQAEAFDELGEKVEFLNGLLENYANIMELLGRKYEDFDIIQSIADNQVAASQRSLEIAKTEYQRLLEEMQKIQKTGDEEAIKEITAQVDEARTAMLDAWSAGLEAVAHQYEVSITNLVKTTEKQLSKFYSLEEAQEFYDQNKSIAELYLEEYDSLYQLNKLTRDINKSMRDQDSLLANQKLSTLLDEINEKRLSGAQMSQHEVDMLQKKYNLRLAEIALEEAQNAKSQMRLTRDASGNWSYTYTADQSKIDEATQKHEDALYEIEKASREYIDEMSEAILSNEEEMMSRISELKVSDYATEEEYIAAIELIRDQHMQKNRFYYSEIEKAIGDVNTAYGEEKIAFEDLTIAKIKNINSANEGLNTFKDSTITLLEGMVEAYKTHSKGVEEFATTMSGDIGQAVKGIGDEIAATDDKMKDLVKTIKNSFSDMMSRLSPMFETLSTAIDGTVGNLDKLIENFLKLQDVQNRANTGYYDEGIDYNSKLTSMAGKKGSDASDGTFAQYLWERGNKVSSPEYAKYANMGGQSFPVAAMLMAAADRNAVAKEWLDNTKKGKSTDSDKVKAFIDSYDKNMDYTEMLIAFLLAGGDPKKDENFGQVWEHFVTKLRETVPGTNQTYRKKYYGGKDDREVWNQLINSNEYLSAEAIPYPFDTGGYTGEWGPEGKLAILHQKELVLNAGDTENFLKSVELMGHIINVIDRNAMLAAAGLALGQPTAAAVNDKVVQQTVAIEASFPGVQSAAEIEQALNNIVNDAAQYASIRKN